RTTAVITSVPNRAVVISRAAPAAQPARRQRRAKPFPRPPGARRATYAPAAQIQPTQPAGYTGRCGVAALPRACLVPFAATASNGGPGRPSYTTGTSPGH